MPGVGWAAGIERLAMLIAEPAKPQRPIAIVPIGLITDQPVIALAEELRDADFVVDLGYSGNVQRRMRRADRVGARAAILIGNDEITANTAMVRDLESGAQSAVPRAQLITHLKALVG
jgi:histidyl-tRNA synthetase